MTRCVTDTLGVWPTVWVMPSFSGMEFLFVDTITINRILFMPYAKFPAYNELAAVY